MQLIDLSQTIEAGMSLFSDKAPQPSIHPWMSHSQAAASGNYEDCSCEITSISMVTSLGTYLDSPYHFFPGGDSIESLHLEQLVLEGVVIDCRHVMGNEPIIPQVLDGIDIEDKAVLFHTGWSRYWKQMAYYDHPFVMEQTAITLVERGARLAGVDFLVIDDTNNPKRPAHVNLLKNNVLIVENLTNLDKLPAAGFTFHAVPVKVRGAAAFPVRAYGTLPGA